MNLSKKSAALLTGIGLLVGSAVTLGLQSKAQTTNSTSGFTNTSLSTNPVSNLVNAIAQRFNLNVNDVQQVFDQHKMAIDAQFAQREADHIQQLVTDGKLTQGQADKLKAKLTELKTFMEGLKDKTPSDRQAAIKSQMDTLKIWAAENNIPTQYLMFGGHHEGWGHGFGGGMMMRMNSNAGTN